MILLPSEKLKSFSKNVIYFFSLSEKFLELYYQEKSMNFLITSKGAININHIVNIHLAKVKEESDSLTIDIMEIDGSIVGDLAKNHFESPCLDDKILTIITI